MNGILVLCGFLPTFLSVEVAAFGSSWQGLHGQDDRSGHCGVKHIDHSFPTASENVKGSSRLTSHQIWSAPGIIDFQSDESKYGRGDFHLSASLEEGDVIVYQTGTWLVDGVEVGDGSKPEFRYARVETVQLVWTHNCEHGVIRGINVTVDGRNGARTKPRIIIAEPFEEVEFGPEQLIARLPVIWDDDADEGVSTVELDESMWKAPDW